jgi:hypothetical protein
VRGYGWNVRVDYLKVGEGFVEGVGRREVKVKVDVKGSAWGNRSGNRNTCEKLAEKLAAWNSVVVY